MEEEQVTTNVRSPVLSVELLLESTLLNENILVHIFEFLEPFLLVSTVKFVCKIWYQLSKWSTFWQRLVSSDFLKSNQKNYGIYKSMIMTAGEHLKYLDLRYLFPHYIMCWVFNCIMDYCPNIQTLILRGNGCLSFPLRGKKTLNKLEYLDVSGCTFSSEVPLPTTLKTLKGGWVSEFQRTYDTYFINSLGNVHQLEHLQEFSIPGSLWISDSILLNGLRNMKLRKLNVSYLKVSDSTLKQIITSDLIDLNLRACSNVSDAILIHLASCCKNLSRINFSCCSVTIKGVQTLANNCLSLKVFSFLILFDTFLNN